MRDRTLLIAHGADADGLASAALLLDDLRARGREVTLRFCDYHELEPVLQAAAHSSYQEIIVADLVLRAASISDALIESLCEGRAFRLFDHHNLEVERRALLEERAATFVWRKDGRCSARLVLDHLGGGGDEHDALADAAQGSDYSGSVPVEREALGAALDRLLRPVSGLDAETIVEALVAGLRGGASWREGSSLRGELAAGYLRASEALAGPFASLVDSLSMHPLLTGVAGALRVACGLASDLLYMKEGLRALRECAAEADLHLVFFASGVVMVALSPRFARPAPDVVAFVESRGGGGRGAMGGFRFDQPTDAVAYAQRRMTLLADLENFWR